MKLKMYALFDTELKEYQVPMCFGNDVMIKRYYEGLLGRAASQGTENYLYNHLDNFVLTCIGEFDTDTAKLESRVPEVVFNLAIFKVDGSPVDVKLEKKVDNKKIG